MMDMSTVSPRKLASMMRGNGVEELLKEPTFPGPDGDEPEYSQAEVIADVINVMRLDNQALGETVDVDIMAKQITADRVASMLADAVQGDPTDLVETFNELEEQRDEILRELMEDDRYEEFIEFKTDVVNTADRDRGGDE